MTPSQGLYLGYLSFTPANSFTLFIKQGLTIAQISLDQDFLDSLDWAPTQDNLTPAL